MASRPDALRVSWFVWWGLVRQLRERGEGKRESGAFLLGQRIAAGGIIRRSIYYDDLDANALSEGYVHLSGEALNRLWDRCAETKLEVLADVHTHPGGVGQSSSDQAYPMISIKGHIALIIPNFAQSATDLSGIGVYRYLGAKKWMTLSSPRPTWRGIVF